MLGTGTGSEQEGRILRPYPSHCQLLNLARQKGKEAISLHPVSLNMGAGLIYFLF